MSTPDWTRNIEQIALSATGDTNRIVGIAGIRAQSGVSMICHSLAKSLAAADMRTLRVDLHPRPATAPAGNPIGVEGWAPGRAKAQSWIKSTADGYDLLEVHTTPLTRPLFANMQRLREVFAEEFAEYRRVIVDLPPLTDVDTESVNPVAAAGACNAVLLVIVVGRDLQPQVIEATRVLRGAGVSVTAAIANEYDWQSTQEEVRKMARKAGRRLAGASQGITWLQNRVRWPWPKTGAGASPGDRPST